MNIVGGSLALCDACGNGVLRGRGLEGRGRGGEFLRISIEVV